MTDKDSNILEQTRLEKLHRLRGAGIEPYPARSQVTHSTTSAMDQFLALEN